MKRTFQETDTMIRVAIVDDDDEMRKGLRRIIEQATGFHCTDFRSGASALETFDENPPDVVLMDIGMPDKTGIEWVGILQEKYPHVQCLMLTVHSDEEKIFQSLRAGAVGYLLKTTTPDKLLTAIREAHAGGAPMTGEVARKVLTYFQQPRQSNVFSSLSQRELDVLLALTEGHTYKSIADKLFVSVNTVRFHLRNIYAKLHVRSRTEAVAKALKSNAV
ncbi:MAG TPA: response regulator transcription factor [Bacteroidota bacterium]|nr:response regulator transcription factor [Bacteroidota bacterium]